MPDFPFTFDTSTDRPAPVDRRPLPVALPPGDYMTCPFRIVIDSREQAPYQFRGMPADSLPRGTWGARARRKKLQASFEFRCFKERVVKKGKSVYLPLVVPTIVAGLETGDYSIDGFESLITVERKSLSDLYGTLGYGRERFERELQRMSGATLAGTAFGGGFKVCHVVVEATWDDVLNHPPRDSKLSPDSVFGSINSWEQRYPMVHWSMMGNRALAEKKCFEILKRFWRENGEK